VNPTEGRVCGQIRLSTNTRGGSRGIIKPNRQRASCNGLLIPLVGGGLLSPT